MPLITTTDAPPEIHARQGPAEPLMLPREYNATAWTHLTTWPTSRRYAPMKRIIDLVGAVALLALTWPVLLIAASLVKCTSRGPVVFPQRRAGRFGKPFTMYKLRTMVRKAKDETILFRDPQGQNGPAFKLRGDPRITPVGRLLRRTSIDELPQLINVILGRMSLVGPRPLPLDEVRLDTLPERARLSVKPGLTGLWQVSGRADVPYDEWIELDLYYVRHRSLWLDLQILLRTIPAVLTCRGAY